MVFPEAQNCGVAGERETKIGSLLDLGEHLVVLSLVGGT
uniref:Uncharacterized protein n=1 Tax=Anopheles atroparvus TaxID=41427 RepID=A0AAG5D282_ANOAO